MAVSTNWNLYILESMRTGLVWIREFGVCGSIMERFKRSSLAFILSHLHAYLCSIYSQYPFSGHFRQDLMNS